MDGKHYACVEVFYQGLRWPNAAKRAEIARLSGREAKFSARGAPKSETFEYEGITYRSGSPEHHELIKRAIRESLEQNPEIRNQFVQTHPRSIEHKTGRPENPNSSFPASVFTRILTELRSEFMRVLKTSKAQPSQLSSKCKCADENARQATASSGNISHQRGSAAILKAAKNSWL
jgi:hypothetical protein